MKNSQITLVFTSIEDMWVDIYTKTKLAKFKYYMCFTSFNLSPLILLWQGKIYDYICYHMYYLLSSFGHMDEGEILRKYHQSILQ